MNGVVIGFILLFGAKGDLLDGVILGSAPSMQVCARQITEAVNAHANDLVPTNSGLVARGFCADTKAKIVQEEVALGEAKAGIGNK